MSLNVIYGHILALEGNGALVIPPSRCVHAAHAGVCGSVQECVCVNLNGAHVRKCAQKPTGEWQQPLMVLSYGFSKLRKTESPVFLSLQPVTYYGIAMRDQQLRWVMRFNGIVTNMGQIDVGVWTVSSRQISKVKRCHDQHYHNQPKVGYSMFLSLRVLGRATASPLNELWPKVLG